MLATTSFGPSAPSKLLGAPTSELKFRIQGGEHHGRSVRIAAAKCTIGSAAGCTLRLRRSDIDPLHCMILTGRNGTVVRRNSPRTYLNGGAFEDSLLQAGDVLRLGSLELVVESCPPIAAARLPKGPPTPAPADDLSGQMRRDLEEQITRVREQSTEQINRLEKLVQERQTDNSRLGEELAALNEQLRAAREQQEAKRSANLEREEIQRRELEQARQLAAEAESRLAERDNAFQQLSEAGHSEVVNLRQTLASLQQSREQDQQESAARNQELEAQRSELVRRQEECASAAEQLASLQNLLQESRQQAQEREAQQQQATAEFAEQRGRWEESIASLTEQLSARQAETADAIAKWQSALALNAELEGSRPELQELRLKLSHEELKLAHVQSKADEQLAEMTERLVERERELAGRDQELVELRQRAAQLAIEDQVLREVRETLAVAEAAHQSEREAWISERRELESNDGALESQRSELIARQEELEAKRSELAARQGEWERRQSELDGQRGILEDQRRQFESERGELMAQRDAMAAQRSELERQSAEIIAQRDSLRARDEELQSQASSHHEAARRCETLEVEVSDLRAKLQQNLDQEAAAALAKEQESQPHEEQVERWQSEAHKWQIQAEEVSGQLGEFKQSCARLKDEINELRGESRNVPAEAATEQPAVSQDELRLQQQGLDEARARLQEEQLQLERLQSELREREGALARFDADVRARESAWEFSRGEQTSALEERTQLINMQIAQFEAEQAAYARQQATMVQQMSALEDRVQELTRNNRTNLKVVALGAVDAPISSEVDSVVNRLSQAGIWKEEQQDESAGPDVASSPEGSAGGHSHEDDSIEQYMSRLMNRVRGGDSSASRAPWVPASQAEQVSVPSAASPSENQAPAEPKEYVPRVQAPEHPERLSLMRELANSAAKSAIHTHARQHQSRQTRHKSLVALLSLFGAVSLFAAGFFTGSYLALCGAAIFMSICCVMSMRAMVGGLKQLRLRRPQTSAAAPRSAAVPSAADAAPEQDNPSEPQ